MKINDKYPIGQKRVYFQIYFFFKPFYPKQFDNATKTRVGFRKVATDVAFKVLKIIGARETRSYKSSVCKKRN